MESVNMDETIRRRNKVGAPDDVENLPPDNEEEKLKEVPKKDFKYYFNRFRYYHYVFAETVETCIGVVCLTIIKIYFFLMGYRSCNQGSEGMLDDVGDVDDD